MDLLPPQKFVTRQWRFGRKRRRSGTEAAESEGNRIDKIKLVLEHLNDLVFFGILAIVGDSKIVKKDAESTSMDTSPSEPLAEPSSAPAPPPPTEPAAANGN